MTHGHIIGVDFACGPDVTVIATFEDGRCTNVRPFRRLRRPWRIAGRKATRAHWRRTGRR